MDILSLTSLFSLLLIFTSAIIGGILAKKLKLPPVVGYIVVGCVLGNIGTPLLQQTFIQTIETIGITLLLFTLGIEFSFQRLKNVLGSISWAAIAQILIVTLGTYSLLVFLGTTVWVALLFACVSSFSSTAIVVRYLSDRGEVDTVPGETATGWLVIQDLAVIPVMLLLPTFARLSSVSDIALGLEVLSVVKNLIVSAVLILAIFILGKHAVPRLLNFVSKRGSREMLLVTIVGLVLLSAGVSASFGVSAAVGAFIAGLIVSETSQNHAVFAEIRPLRDIFAVLFFVSMGMSLPFETFAQAFPGIVLLTVFVLALKAASVYVPLRFLSYHRKTATIVSLLMLPMSEFGFVIASAGMSLGLLDSNQEAQIIALIFSSIIVSAPLLSHTQEIYAWIGKRVAPKIPIFLPLKEEKGVPEGELQLRDHVVLCGYGRVGKYVGRALEMEGVPFIVVDYNHTTVQALREKGIPVVFGDPADREVLDVAQVDFARAVVIALPDLHTQRMVVASAVTLNPKVKVICRTHHEEDQSILKTLGVTDVVQPEFEAALSITHRLLDSYSVPREEIGKKISRLKIEHGMG